MEILSRWAISIVRFSEWRGENDCGHCEYQSLDEMLIDWLDELEKNESKEKFDEEIEFIKSMSMKR